MQPLAHTQPPLHDVLLASTWVAGLLPHPKDHEGGTGSLFPSGDPNHTSRVSRCPVPGYKPQVCSGAGIELVLLPAAVYLNTASLQLNYLGIIYIIAVHLPKLLQMFSGTETSQTFTAKEPRQRLGKHQSKGGFQQDIPLIIWGSKRWIAPS